MYHYEKMVSKVYEGSVLGLFLKLSEIRAGTAEEIIGVYGCVKKIIFNTNT